MARKTTIRNDETDPEERPGADFGAGVGGSGRRKTGGGDDDPDDPDQQRFDDELRPSRLEDVVGQKSVVERLRILLEATKRRKEPL